MRRLLLLAACGLVLLAPVAARGATVKGTVTPTGWAQEVEVCVVEELPSETCAAPAGTGSYSLNVSPASPVRIEFLPSYRSRLARQYYDDVENPSLATIISLPKEESVAEGIDADLIEGAALEGTVTAAGSAEPLSEVEVCAVLARTATVEVCGESDASGDYELHSLPTGSYSVRYSGTGKSSAYEPLQRSVILTAETTTSGFNASLARGAQIQGRVTGAADGLPLGGIPVCLFAASGSAAERCTESDPVGAYGFVGLPAGSYEVGFSLGPAEIGGAGTSAEVGGFVPQYYDGVTTRAAATPISLLSAQTVDGVDAALSTLLPATISQVVPLVRSPTALPAPVVTAPKPKVTKPRCKKPARKQKVKGKVRCVRPNRHKPTKKPRR